MTQVLVVDDDSTLRLVLVRRLETYGYGVTAAACGVEALALLDKTAPDIVISDIVMPTMDGFEFCRQLRSRPGGQLIPFIFLSSLGDLGHRVEGHRMGADDYLVKPFPMQELQAKIEGLVIRSRQVHQEVERMVHLLQAQQTAQNQAPLPFSPAEEKVFWEVVQGFTNKQVAERLFLSPRTVQTHLSSILTKLNISNRAQLVRFAFENGYHPPVMEPTS